jgi:hypothetical protein
MRITFTFVAEKIPALDYKTYTTPGERNASRRQ